MKNFIRCEDRDLAFMRVAYEEAKRGGWYTHPNPNVGAVLVRDNRIIGRGFHVGVGQAHAEVVALEDARRHGEDVRGADLYVSLEPCCHYGHTGPCTEALISAGIGRCFIGSLDPDKRVSGEGLRRLVSSGISCEVGLLEEEFKALNAAYFKRVSEGLCFVSLKWAMTIDGRIASSTGDSKWITGVEARENVHFLRSLYDAIIVGTETVINDDCQLTVRLSREVEVRQPLRVILDRRGRICREAKVWDVSEARSVVFTSQDACYDEAFFESRGIRVHRVGEQGGGLDIVEVLRTLVQEHNVTTLLCEGGGRLHGSLYDAGVVDSLWVYIAAKVFGSMEGLSPVEGRVRESMCESGEYLMRGTERFGSDIRIELRRRELGVEACLPV